MEYLSKSTQLITIFLLSIFKYGFGLITAVNSSIGFWPSILTNLLGGAIGILMFIYFGTWFTIKYHQFKLKYFNYNRFGWWNKLLVRIRKNFGLRGIAIIAPVLITIPVGVILALQITSDKKRIFKYMFGSCIVWSILIFIGKYVLEFGFLKQLF